MGLDRALLAMLHHLLSLPPEEAEVAVEVVLRVLGELSFAHTRQSRAGPRVLLRPAMAHAVLDAMMQFASNELVVARGLRVMASLVYRCDESKRVLQEWGGLDCIVAAMVRHDETEVVFSAGMSAIANFTFRTARSAVQRTRGSGIVSPIGKIFTILSGMPLRVVTFGYRCQNCSLAAASTSVSLRTLRWAFYGVALMWLALAWCTLPFVLSWHQ